MKFADYYCSLKCPVVDPSGFFVAITLLTL